MHLPIHKQMLATASLFIRNTPVTNGEAQINNVFAQVLELNNNVSLICGELVRLLTFAEYFFIDLHAIQY